MKLICTSFLDSSYEVKNSKIFYFLYEFVNKNNCYYPYKANFGNLCSIKEIIIIAIRELNFKPPDFLLLNEECEYSNPYNPVDLNSIQWFSKLGSFVIHENHPLNNVDKFKEACDFILHPTKVKTNKDNYVLYEIIMPRYQLIDVYKKHAKNKPEVMKKLRLDFIPEAEKLETKLLSQSY